MAAIAGVVFYDSLPKSDSSARDQFVKYALYAAIALGVIASLRLGLQRIRGGTALRVDSAGITTAELAMRKKGSERSRKFVPWEHIDTVILQNERTAPQGGDSFLCIYQHTPNGDKLLHRTKVIGWSLDMDKLSQSARMHAPNVQVSERHVGDGS